ncbi:MAG: hypothetical protein L6311_15095 [Cellulomonas sp.]|nr:hypothetical protein [Cellulomonas sp.]
MTTRLRTFAVLPAALVLTVSLLSACNNTAEPKAPSETMTEGTTMMETPAPGETMMETPMTDETMMESPTADETMMDGSMKGDG